MRKLTIFKKSKLLLFALFAFLAEGTSPAWAQETVNEGFEDWTTDGVADGWLLINGATYGNTYSYDYVVGSSDFTPSAGSNCLANSGHSAAQGTTSSPMIVTPAMTGTFTFKFRKYNSSSSTKGYINVFEYDEGTGAAVGSSIWTCRPNGTNEATSKYQDATITVGSSAKRYAIYLAKVSIDELSYTPAVVSPYKEPATLTYETVTVNSAVINWTAASSEASLTGWDLEYKKSVDNSWSEVHGLSASTLTYTLTELTDNTSYDVQLKAIYGENESGWKSTTFKTLRAPISSFPWSEDFTGLTSGNIPDGWDNAEGTTTSASYKWTYYASDGHDANPCVRFDSYNNSNGNTNFLKTPVMNFTQGAPMQLKFWYKNPTGGDFSVYISNDGGATYTTELAAGLTGASSWTEKVVDLPTDTYYENVVIVFKGTSNYGSGDARIYLDDVLVKEKSDSEPILAVTPDEDAAFGTITAETNKTYTVTNAGTGLLTVNITSDDAKFTVAPAQLTDIAAGESKTFTVTFTPVAETYGTFNANITVSPTYDAEATVSIAASAKVKNPNIWSEDFSGNTLPEGWEITNGTYWKIQDNMLKGSYSYGNYDLVTPSLIVEGGQTLSFDYRMTSTYRSLDIQYSKDNGAWTNYGTISYSGLTQNEWYTYTISGLEAGKYKFRFSDSNYDLDNFEGFNLNPNDPKFGVYTDADCTVAAAASVTKDFGFVTEDATQTYYIKNDGTGTLVLDQDEVPAGFSAVLGESELAAGESTTLAITFGQISGGYRGGNIVVNGSDGSTFTVAVSGVMVDEDKLNLDFATANIPSTWTNTNWTKNEGGFIRAPYSYSGNATLVSGILTAEAGEELVIVARSQSSSSSYTVGVNYKKADADEWSTLIAAVNPGTSWTTLHAPIAEAGDYIFQFTANYSDIQHIYGLTEPTEPVMVVYDGEAKAANTYNFGNVANDADATHTFTVKNEGKAVLAGLTATLSGDQAGHYDVAITGLTDGGVAANGEATIAVTQKKDNLGSHAATLTISSTSESIADFVIELSGVTRDASTLFVDFADGNMPEGWTVGTSWTVTSGYAQQTSYSTASALVTTPLTVTEGETLTFEAARYSSYSAAQLKVRYTTDGGITWSEYVDYAAQITSGSFVTLTLTDVPAGTAIVEFYGRYVKLDNISGFAPTTAPVLALTEGTAAVASGSTKEFGNLTEAGVATYTLTNNGTADMVTTVGTTGVATAAISGEGEGITIAENTVTLAAGKSATVTLTLPYEAPFGEKAGAMTLTTEGWVGDFTVNYTATTIDPTALFVDFSSNAKPAGWYNSGFSFTSGAATINSSTEATFITEKLTVSGTDDVLSYDAVVSSSWASSYASLVVSYSTDRRNWTEIATLGENDLTTTFQTFTVSGLEAGEYYLQFKGKYVTIDNIIGWHKVTGIEHDLFFVSIDVPEGEYVPGSEYTATVKVVNLRAASETVAAELFVKNEKATELTEQVIALDETKTFTLTATVPEEGKHLAYVKVYNNDVTIETEPVTFVSAHNRTLEITDFARTSNETVDADANNEFTSTFNVTVKNNGTLDQNAENVSVSITDADGNVIGENATAWTLANSQTVFINPGAYTTDGAVLAIWRWNTDVDGEWALLTKINDELYSVERNGKTNFCIVRLKKEGDEGYSSENGGLNWTNCYNQSTNMMNTDGNFFSFKSWGDVDGEGHHWFNFGTMTNLPVGASTTMSVSLTTSALEGGVFTFKAKENVSNTVSTASATVTVNAAAPKFELALGSTAIEDGDAVAYGVVKAATTKTFTISNTGNKLMEAPSISVPEGFEYETVAANGAEVDWRLFFYKENTDLSADQGSFKATATENKFIIENVNVPYEGVVFSVHNDAWTNKYGWSDEGGTLDATGKAVKLAAHGDDANGWMTIPAGNYDFVWNANDLTLLAKPAGSILAGETADVSVTLKAEQGKVSGNLVFTYKVDATTNGTFNVALSGRSIFADTWAFDFEDGQIPADWDNSNNWTVGESEGNHYATLTGWVAKSIMTPRLAAEANEELTFDVLSVGSSFTYAYSTDKTNWSDEVSVSATGEQTFVAPAEGNYYLRFTTRNGRLDNLVGFRANPLEHDTEIAASSVPVTGKQYNVYTATVTLKESVGKAEEVTACLYVGGEVKTTETQTITANGSTTVTLTWEPQEVISEAVEAYVAVTGTGIDLATEVVSLTIAEVYTLDEATSASTVDAVSNETVLLKRKFAAGWNTVCLPFAINDVEAFFGEGAKAYDFTAYNTTNGELSFSTVSTLSASYPYVVYVPVAITEPMKLQNITISSYNDYGYYRTFNGVKFQGTYAPIAAGEWGATGVVYGLTSEGRIAKAGANASMKGFRAYFDIPSGSSVKALRFEDIEDAISLIQTDAEENEAIYNVAGQRVQKMQKGINIINGKKILK